MVKFDLLAMSGKNKPKRLDRHRNYRVARRKRKLKEYVSGNPRNRKKREKKRKVVSVVDYNK